MTIKSLLVTFLIAVVLLAGSARAESNPEEGLVTPNSGQDIGHGEMTGRPEMKIPGQSDVALPEKGAVTADESGVKPVPGAEAVPEVKATPGTVSEPGTEAIPKTETTPEKEAAPEDIIEEATVSDPIEPWNRAMFQFNDKLYFWALKPVARGYNAVVPEPVRVSVRNFFRNVTMPIRFVNCLLQGKFAGAGIELSRFLLNSTIGLAGFFDVATSRFELEPSKEDFGQTLGFYGMGPLMYIVWPFLGPSNVRDSVGYAGDTFLDPVNYINPFEVPLGIHAYDRINETSLEIGTYEDMKKSALDPYIAVRDAYIQYRNGQIKK